MTHNTAIHVGIFAGECNHTAHEVQAKQKELQALQKTIVRQQKMRQRLKDAMKNVESSISVDAVANQVREIDQINEQHQIKIKNLERFNKVQRRGRRGALARRAPSTATSLPAAERE